jgi:hypothetical protein
MFPFSLQLCIPADRTHPRPLGNITSSSISSTYKHILKINNVTSQIYRKAVLSATPTKYFTVSRITAGSWRLFWKAKLNFKAKNVWYDIIQDKINTNSRMHRIIRDRIESPYCQICSEQSTHNIDHMFVTCQRIWQIWKRTLQYTFPLDQSLLTLAPKQVLAGLYSLHLPLRNTEQPTLKYLFAPIIESIWRHHWQFTIHNMPFDPNLAVGSAINFFRNYTGNSTIGPSQSQSSSES